MKDTSVQLEHLPAGTPLPHAISYVLLSETRSGGFDVALVEASKPNSISFPRYRNVDGKDRALELGLGLAQQSGSKKLFVLSRTR